MPKIGGVFIFVRVLLPFQCPDSPHYIAGRRTDGWMKQPLVTRASHRVWLIAQTKRSLHSSAPSASSVPRRQFLGPQMQHAHAPGERESESERTPADISGISHENQRDILAPPSFEFLIFLESESEAALSRLSPCLPPSLPPSLRRRYKMMSPARLW